MSWFYIFSRKLMFHNNTLYWTPNTKLYKPRITKQINEELYRMLCHTHFDAADKTIFGFEQIAYSQIVLIIICFRN